MGTFIIIDFSTRKRIRLDVGRVLISTSSSEIINRVVSVNINGVVFFIRLMEEHFGGSFSDKDQSCIDVSPAYSSLVVPETANSPGEWEEDLQRLQLVFSNLNFEKGSVFEDRSGGSCRLGSDARDSYRNRYDFVGPLLL